MRQSESIEALAAALVAAQAELEPVSKDKENPFFKSKYADLAAVMAAALPVITKHGLAVTQFPSHDGTNDVLCSILLHTSGQFISAEMLLHPVKVDPQAQGSALTYARRYSFMAILGLVADEDDDGNAASQAPRSRARAKSPTARPARASGDGEGVARPAPSPPSEKRNPWAEAIHIEASRLKIEPDVLDSILLNITGDTTANGVNRGNKEQVLAALRQEAGVP